MKPKWRMYQQVDRKRAVAHAGTETCALHQRLVFVLAGQIGREQPATSADRPGGRSRLRHAEMWQTWISQAAPCLTQAVGACGEAARLPVGKGQEK